MALLVFPTACNPHPDFTSWARLWDRVALDSDVSEEICARIAVKNVLLAGMYTFTTGQTEKEEVDEKLEMTSIAFNFTIYDGTQGHLRNIHNEGSIEGNPVPYGETITVDIPFDPAQSPQDLVAPFFDLGIAFTVDKIEEDNEAGHWLGFENGRYRRIEPSDTWNGHFPGQSDAAEGFCGYEYQYVFFSADGEYDDWSDVDFE